MSWPMMNGRSPVRRDAVATDAPYHMLSMVA